MVLERDFVLVMLQFLEEANFKKTAHDLEQESGVFFNMAYVESLVTNGDWDEVEKYLSSFAKVNDDEYSVRIFFEIRKQKYLEALDRQDRAKAEDILAKELKVVCCDQNEVLFKEMTQLLNSDNIRENENFAKYGDIKSERVRTFSEVKKGIKANPVFRDKLQFPIMNKSRLRTLIIQSLNWQHTICENPRPNPDIKTLIMDHDCGPPSAVTELFKIPFVSKSGAHGHGAHGPASAGPVSLHALNATVVPPLKRPRTPHNKGASVDSYSDDLRRALEMSMSTPTLLAAAPMKRPWTPRRKGASVDSHSDDDLARAIKMSMPTHSTLSGPLISPLFDAALLKRPRTPPCEGASIEFEPALKRSTPFGLTSERSYDVLEDHVGSSYSSHDLPINAVMQLPQGSAVKSMDFHPLQPILLLVGTNIGDVMVWELVTQKVVFAKFKVWVQCSVPLQSASVNRVMWSPDGTLFGVAYSMHLVHLFSYTNSSDFCELRNPLEIEAHAGSVNDLAFSCPTEQLCVITCGEDGMIKVWDATTGNWQRTLHAHAAPICSVCPNHRAYIKFFYSTATDGGIRQWEYDDEFPTLIYSAPFPSPTIMAYSDDELRLFSCGTNLEGVSYLAEWNEKYSEVKRIYRGLEKRSVGVIQFDTTSNKFLAAGHDFSVKYWDMNNETPLITTNAEGRLAASPCVRFNNNGTLLAVSTYENGVQVLASDDGLRWLGMPPAVGKSKRYKKSDNSV